MPGFEHRIGGLEGQQGTGNVSYDPLNHEKMSHTREAKIQGIANFIPEQEVFGPESGDVLVLSWGGTYGSVFSAVSQAQKEGKSVAHAHVRYLNPLPRNLEALLKNYKRILVPELNMGQLSHIIQSTYGIEVESFNKIQGQPFKIRELTDAIDALLA